MVIPVLSPVTSFVIVLKIVLYIMIVEYHILLKNILKFSVTYDIMFAIIILGVI